MHYKFTNIVTVSNLNETVEFIFQSDSQKEANQAFVALCGIFDNGYGSPQLKDSKGNILAILIEKREIPIGESFIDSFLQSIIALYKKIKGWFGL